MKTEIKSKEKLSFFQRRACFIVDAVSVLLLGIFLLLVGLDLTLYDFDKIIYFALLLFLGSAMLLNSCIQINSLLLWIGSFVMVCGIYGFLAQGISGIDYRDLYPIVLAAPAIASLLSLSISKEKRMHVYISLFFGVISLIFSLESGGILPINIVLPIVFMVIGIIIFGAVFIKGEKNGK